MQALWQQALVPVTEVRADPNSCGFRIRRSVSDAIEQCFIILSRQVSAPWIFEGDIKAYFDTLSHDWLEAKIPMDKVILRKFLKAGYVDQAGYSPTLTGTPQGEVISLTLTVMALSGLESFLKRRYPHHKVNAEALIRELNSKILGFATFFRHVLSSKDRSTIDKEI